MKIIKFILIIVSFLILNLFTIFNSVQAIDINSANIVSGGDCGKLLTYKGIVVETFFAQYINKRHP